MLSAQKVGLVLSGGGARALAQIGVLKVLDSLDVKVDYIAGTSTGAMIGALYAMGYSGKEIEEILLSTDWKDIFNDQIKRNDYNIAQKRWMPLSKYYFFIDRYYKPQLPKAFLFGNKFLIKIFDFTYPTYQINDYCDLPIPFRCVSTNLLTGEKKIFNKGSLHESIRASMAFPSILQPFNLDNNLYIDGGITDNFPVDIAKKMGADYLIGVKTNSGLKKIDEVANILDILEQTMNINIIKKVKEESEECDLVISPQLNEYSFLNFDLKKDIINSGEEESQKNIRQLSKLPKWNGTRKSITKKNSPIKFDKIIIMGNRYLSKAKIKEYLELNTKEYYSKDDISNAFIKAYNTGLFNYIYPVIKKENDKIILKVVEEEKLRKTIGLNLLVRNDDEFSANLYGIFTNLLQKNSKLVINAKIGSNKEILEDYVKNFGRNWGAYFRIFSNMSGSNLIIYNQENNYKEKSVTRREREINMGSGLFVKSLFAMELYEFYYNANYSRNIGDYLDTEYQSYGTGLKIYHESLDNFVFPLKGVRILGKYNFLKSDTEKNFRQRLQVKAKVIYPIKNNFSLIYSSEFGFNSKNSLVSQYNPFGIGGMNSFWGLAKDEISAPTYLINRVAVRKRIKKVYLDLQTNFLSYNGINLLSSKVSIWGIGIRVGVDSVLGPVKIAAAINNRGSKYLYFSLGYDFDPFEFSRR